MKWNLLEFILFWLMLSLIKRINNICFLSQDISEKIANFQPSIAQLNQAVERLRSNGQNMEADEILQLTSQYEMAVDKVEQESMKCKQAVAFRQNYTTQKAQLEAVVHECEDEINVVAQSGMPVAERIQKFKVSHPFFFLFFSVLLSF